MNRRSRIMALALLITATFVSASAAQDVEAGRQLAKRWCSGCHETGTAPIRNGVRSDASPSFVAIARMSSTTNLSLRVFLGTPHGRMPDFNLSRQEIADVSAYILSLK